MKLILLNARVQCKCLAFFVMLFLMVLQIMNFNEHRIVQDRDRSNIQIDQSNGKLACAL